MSEWYAYDFNINSLQMRLKMREKQVKSATPVIATIYIKRVS
jgi:hypothetical protein